MKLNLKALGLALLVAAFAMSAVAASAASANQAFFTADTETGEAVIKGEQENDPDTGSPTGTNYLETTDGRRTECHTAKYQATLEEPSTTLTVTPHYADCKASGVTSTVDLNECNFRFHAGTSTSTEDAHGTADLICPGSIKSVTVTIATCTVHIPEQTGLTGVTFTNKGGSTVTVDVDITNQIKYTETDGFLCPFEGNTEGENGDFVSEVTLHGYEDPGTRSDGPTPGPEDTYDTGAEADIHVKPLS